MESELPISDELLMQRQKALVSLLIQHIKSERPDSHEGDSDHEEKEGNIW